MTKIMKKKPPKLSVEQKRFIEITNKCSAALNPLEIYSSADGRMVNKTEFQLLDSLFFMLKALIEWRVKAPSETPYDEETVCEYLGLMNSQVLKILKQLAKTSGKQLEWAVWGRSLDSVVTKHFGASNPNENRTAKQITNAFFCLLIKNRKLPTQREIHNEAQKDGCVIPDKTFRTTCKRLGLIHFRKANVGRPSKLRHQLNSNDVVKSTH